MNKKRNHSGGWIGVDLDGTLVHYAPGNMREEIVGEPIEIMMERVKQWLSEGRRVKIFTARAYTQRNKDIIARWLVEHDIGGLEITNVKDYEMLELWDDRCVQVIPNTGIRADGEIMPL